MADFKTALEALAKGSINLDAISKQLEKLLQQSPQFATKMLATLDEIYQQKKIDDASYAQLKRQINQYRRTHAEQTEGGDGAGGESTVFAQDSATPVNNNQSDENEEEVTQVNEKTRVMDENDQTGGSAFDVTGGSDLSAVDIDISNIDKTQNITSATGPSGTEWADPSAAPEQMGAEMGPGSIIKHRFKLLDVLGVGGMGKVYKGIDLLKEEAKDRNPYMAIKLLNEDFKDHPEAFISLQRESSRQQKLAHPNIATVYDFDRIGGPGTPVFITMELMEGMPLNDYIKKVVRKQNGLPFDEAFTIIKQLGAALSYAHDRRLVHSDFKPGNAFLCNDGTVKTLDFGIARAVKNPVTGEGEKTLFDPGKLGALTPAYASLEMLEGEEPDTRDDTYALGCVAYELLTGKHPFNKLPANKAMENNLQPPYIKTLKKRQNKALRKAVAFKREDRSETVDDFIEELEAKYIWYKHPPTVAAAVILLLAIGATAPVINYFHKKEVAQIITDIKTGNPQTIVSSLDKINEFEKAEQLSITDEAKDSIQNFFKNQISKLIDTSNDNYNFNKADQILAQIKTYYPDSSFLQEQTDIIAQGRKQKLAELYTEFSAALADPTKLDTTKGILDTIRLKVDARNPLLTDPRPSNQYRVLADDAFDRGDYGQAMTFVTSGLTIAPNDQQLKDSEKKIQRAIKVAELQQKIGAVEGQLASLDDYKNIEPDIKDLANLNPSDPLLTRLSYGFKNNIDSNINTMITSGSRADAEQMAEKYGDLLIALQLGKELTQIKLAHLTGEERTQAIQKIASANNAKIDELLASPQLDDDNWKSTLLANVRELDSLSSEDPSLAAPLAAKRDKIGKLFIDQAKTIMVDNRFDAATAMIDSGERFAPGMNEMNNTRNEINNAKAEHEKKLKIEGLEKDFYGQIDGNQIVKALEYFNQLKEELPANDNFLTTDGPTAIAKSYGTLAESRFEAKDYTNALKLADEGLKYNPGDSQLKSKRAEYLVEANIIDLTNTFKTDLTFNTEDVLRKLGEIENGSPSRYSQFRTNSINELTQRINSLKDTDQNSAATLAQNSAAIFRGTSLEKLRDEIKPKPWPEYAAANSALNTGRLTEATKIQQEAAANFTGHPDYVKFSDELAKKKEEALQSFQLYKTDKEAAGQDYDKLVGARSLLRRAESLWTDNPDYTAAEDEINKLIADNSPVSKKVIQREEVNLEAAVANTAEPGKAAEEWKPISSGRECNNKLAGYGRRAKAICFDLVNNGWRGPLMVVVPKSESQKSFAIGKYEISIGDYSKYCALTGKCKPVTDKDKFDEPQTGISLQDAQEYVKWLSERTGKKYRLPTDAEWTYAANANGEQPRKDYNCRVALGDKIIKGTGPVSVVSGQQNGWGLKNYIGNVQEWVIEDDNSVKARGGAYDDAFSNCGISLVKPQNGEPDPTTGFRVVLDGIG